MMRLGVAVSMELARVMVTHDSAAHTHIRSCSRRRTRSIRFCIQLKQDGRHADNNIVGSFTADDGTITGKAYQLLTTLAKFLS